MSMSFQNAFRVSSHKAYESVSARSSTGGFLWSIKWARAPFIADVSTQSPPRVHHPLKPTLSPIPGSTFGIRSFDTWQDRRVIFRVL